MKLKNLRSSLWSLAVAALLVSLPFLCSEAQAQRRGGGGYHGGGGFSGGSFRGGGGWAQGPRGGTVAEGPRGREYAQTPQGGEAYRGTGGAAVRGPAGGAAARGPYGGAAARGPAGGTAYRPPTSYPAGGGTYTRNVNVSGNWSAYYGPGYRPYPYAGAAAAGLAVGATVAYLSAAAQPVVVNNQTYYVDGTTYYQKCYKGSEVAYCVVPKPN